MMSDSLQYRYNAIISEYLARFAERNDLELDPADMQSYFFFFTGGLYLFSIDEIRLDVDQSPGKRMIVKWYCSQERILKDVNYRSYLMGLRI